MPTDTPNSPLSDADIEQYVRKVAADEYAKANPQQEVAASPAPFTLNIAGKEMSFKDATEASAVLTSVYQEQANRNQPQPAVGRTVTSDNDAPTWTPEDQSRYVDMLVKNPLEAQDYLDERRFGFKNPAKVIRDQMATVQSMATQMTIDQFVSQHKDYHVSPENASAMQTVLSELGGGRPVINPMSLEAAYAIADKRGLLKRPEAAQSQPQSYNPYLSGPPVAGRTSSHVSQSFEDDAENLTFEQIEAILKKAQR